jgi:hypothetical protein
MECRVHQTDMRERLGKIAQQTFSCWIIFFGQQADIVSNGKQAFEQG